MKNARIFLVEDNDKIAEALHALLEDTDHSIVLRAGTLEKVIAVVEDGELEKNAVNMAFIDNGFPEKEGERELYIGFLANKVIKRRNKDIKTVAFTAMMKEAISYGDHYLEKPVNSQDVFNAIEAA
jgi:CheY-like chemotaxis protein